MKAMQAITKIIRNNNGGGIVEFAIILPLLLVLIFGIIEFSVLFYDKAMITNASREGARAGIVWNPDSDERLSDAEIETVVQDYLQNCLINLGDDSNATITVSPSFVSRVSGVPLTVTVDYQYDFLVLPGFMAGLSGLQLQAQTIMRME